MIDALRDQPNRHTSTPPGSRRWAVCRACVGKLRERSGSPPSSIVEKVDSNDTLPAGSTRSASLRVYHSVRECEERLNIYIQIKLSLHARTKWYPTALRYQRWEASGEYEIRKTQSIPYPAIGWSLCPETRVVRRELTTTAEQRASWQIHLPQHQPLSCRQIFAHKTHTTRLPSFNVRVQSPDYRGVARSSYCRNSPCAVHTCVARTTAKSSSMSALTPSSGRACNQ